MDCFVDFYERLDSLCDYKEPIENDDDDVIADITSDLSFGISEEYFDKVDHASSQLLSFYEKYIADSRMHQSLHEHIITRRRKNYDDLKLVLMVDILRAYEGLDHSTRLNSPEGIALLLILVKFFKPDFFLSFSGLKSIPSDIINLDGLIPYVSACSDEIDIPKDESVVSLLLLDVHPQADKVYRTCLYYLFSAVSSVDGVVSQSEKEFLLSLLHLDDNDLSNDIHVIDASI